MNIHRLIKTLGAAAFSIVFALSLQASNQLKCTVTNSAGETAEKNVELLLTHTASGRDWKKKTNDKGQVEFKGLPDGTFDMQGNNLPGRLVTKASGIELSGDEKATCSPVLVSVDVLNALLQDANVAIQTNKNDEALRMGREAVEIAPNVGNTHFILAVALARTGDLETATTHAERAAELNEQFVPMVDTIKIQALGAQADDLLTEKDFDGAISKYEQASEIDPGQAIIYYNMSLAYAHKKELSKALEFVDKAIALDPADAEFQQRKIQLEDMFQKELSKPLEL